MVTGWPALLFRKRGKVVSRLILLFDRHGRPHGYHGPLPEDKIPAKEPEPSKFHSPRELEAFKGELRSWGRDHGKGS